MSLQSQSIITLVLLGALALAPAAEAQMAPAAPAVRSPAVGGGMMGMTRGMNQGSTAREQGSASGMSGGANGSATPSASDCQRMMQSGGVSADLQQSCRAAMASPPSGGSSPSGQSGH